ncbi:MAG: FAD-dependent oxidoreductase [Gammaproteobacteria bacterium]|nr:FAD-dependent oxidoreductase [Gammaproteobacteria bacterium]
MAKSQLFRKVKQAFRLARMANAHGISTQEAMVRRDEATFYFRQHLLERRKFLKISGALAGATMFPEALLAADRIKTKARIAIVGGGTAGIVCAAELAKQGVTATIYEANPHRLGGRMCSSRRIAGKVIERGGEFVDSENPLLLAYAKQLGLTLEDVEDIPGESFFFLNGKAHSEESVVEQIRVFAKRIAPDQAKIHEPTFFKHTKVEVALDSMDLAAYLDKHARDLPLARVALDLACNIEYGLETSEQSALNLLLSLEVDDEFSPLGIYSDERYHITEGSDQIPIRLAKTLPGKIEQGMRLTRLARNGQNQFELYFNNLPTAEIADAVVLAIPFTVLRTVELDASLKLSADKMRAINTLRYGDNVKTMYAFNGRPWIKAGNSGDVLSDLPQLQNTWETNWSQHTEVGVITNYSGGNLARRLQGSLNGSAGNCSDCHGEGSSFMQIKPNVLQAQAEQFLTDYDKVIPGAKAVALKDSEGRYVLERAHWSAQQFSRGSYVGNQPGYFTGIAGLEAQSAGALKFAGEHTSSFYDWQGYMEGAAMSGVAAAKELLADIRARRISG